MDKNLLLIGGGGHCESILDTLYQIGEFNQIGIVDNDKEMDAKILGAPVVGRDSDLKKLTPKYNYAFISIGSIGNTKIRRKLYSYIEDLGFKIPNIIDPSANVTQSSILGNGIFIGKNAVVNCATTIGDAAIINTGAILEHNCYVGKFSHISPGATVCGNVYIGSDVHLGANSTIIQGKKIEDKIIIGAGSVVTKNLLKAGTYLGVPARKYED